MKHLFIVDPKASSVSEATQTCEIIRSFFSEFKHHSYDIHVVHWSRDAVSFVRRYIEKADDIVRVYATGGDTGLFEVVNGAIGLTNAQVACLNIGRNNSFVKSFGEDNLDLFDSLRNLVSANTCLVDVIKCGINYAINNVLIGYYVKCKNQTSGIANFFGSISSEKLSFLNILYNYDKSVIYQHYDFNIDGVQSQRQCESIFICNGTSILKDKTMRISRPNDGYMDLAVIPSRKGMVLGRRSFDFTNKTEEVDSESMFIKRTKSLVVSSLAPMYIAMDGEIYLDNIVELAILPQAIEFVVPLGIV